MVPRPAVWEAVNQLKDQGMEVYLLSNYSERFFYKQLTQTTVLPIVDGMVVSFQVHYLKPEKEIYQILLDRYHLKRNESIFFDDRAENVEMSNLLGMDAIQVLSEEQLLQDLKTIEI